MRMKFYAIAPAMLGGTAVALWQSLSMDHTDDPLILKVTISIGVGLVTALLVPLLFPLARRLFGDQPGSRQRKC